MSAWLSAVKWLFLLAPVVCSFFAARGILHYFQLESYQFPGYFRTLRRNRVHSMLPGLCVTVVCMLLYYALYRLVLADNVNRTGAVLALALFLPVSALAGWGVCKAFSEKKEKKKPNPHRHYG